MARSHLTNEREGARLNLGSALKNQGDLAEAWSQLRPHVAAEPEILDLENDRERQRRPEQQRQAAEPRHPRNGRQHQPGQQDQLAQQQCAQDA